MNAPDNVLDLVSRLFASAGHPDIVRAERYQTSAHHGVEVVYRSNAKAHLWLTKAETTPAELPEQLPHYRFRVQHALKLLVDLLEAAKPAGVTAWRTVKVGGFDLSASGIELRTDGGVVLLKVTGGSPTGLDADPAEWADWRIPADIAERCWAASTA